MKNKILFYTLMVILLIFANSCKKDKYTPPETVTDIDGNVYHTVKIGIQVWLVENLKVTKYRKGDPIPSVTDNTAWSNLTTGAYCDYENTPSNSTTYGKLYNWYAVNDSRNIAPDGWHIPNNTDWLVLTNYLGGGSAAGGKLKEAGTTHWQSPNTGATNETGFTALPGSYRDFYGAFNFIGNCGYWWSYTELDTGNAYCRGLYYSYSNIFSYTYIKTNGYSVRCIMD